MELPLLRNTLPLQYGTFRNESEFSQAPIQVPDTGWGKKNFEVVINKLNNWERKSF